MSQLDKDIKKCEDRLADQEEGLEVAEVDFSTCESLRDDVINVDNLYVDISALNRRIDELKDQVCLAYSQRQIYTSDFIGRFRNKLAHFTKYNYVSI